MNNTHWLVLPSGDEVFFREVDETDEVIREFVLSPTSAKKLARELWNEYGEIGWT